MCVSLLAKALDRSAARVKFREFLMPAPHIGIMCKPRHQAAMLLAFPMVDMIIVAIVFAA